MINTTCIARPHQSRLKAGGPPDKVASPSDSGAEGVEALGEEVDEIGGEEARGAVRGCPAVGGKAVKVDSDRGAWE